MGTTPLQPDFKEFLKLLNSNDVEYLLVGGFAVAFHGYPRPTGDMDIWIAVNPANAEKAAETLRQFGFTTAISSEMFFGEKKVFRMGLPPVRIELITRVSGLEFSAAYTRRIRAIIDGVEVSYLSLDDLKVNKRASGRPKDLADLSNLPKD